MTGILKECHGRQTEGKANFHGDGQSRQEVGYLQVTPIYRGAVHDRCHEGTAPRKKDTRLYWLSCRKAAPPKAAPCREWTRLCVS